MQSDYEVCVCVYSTLELFDCSAEVGQLLLAQPTPVLAGEILADTPVLSIPDVTLTCTYGNITMHTHTPLCISPPSLSKCVVRHYRRRSLLLGKNAESQIIWCVEREKHVLPLFTVGVWLWPGRFPCPRFTYACVHFLCVRNCIGPGCLRLETSVASWQ